MYLVWKGEHLLLVGRAQREDPSVGSEEAFAHVRRRDTQTCVFSALGLPEHTLDILVEETGLAFNIPPCFQLAISKRGRIIHKAPCLIYIYICGKDLYGVCEEIVWGRSFWF